MDIVLGEFPVLGTRISRRDRTAIVRLDRSVIRDISSFQQIASRVTRLAINGARHIARS